MKIEKNDNLALIIGFSLIILVIIFTLLRGKIFTGDDSQKLKPSKSSTQAYTPAYATISAPDLNNKIILAGKKADFTLLDIRPFESYIAEHIVDAVNIPIDEFPVGLKIDAHKQIFIIGASSDDKDIDTAISKLKDEKIDNITVLAGGMESWKQLIGATVSYGDPKSFTDQAKVTYLDPTSLNDALKQKVKVFIVDVRDPQEFAKGHIASAINIPFDDLEKRRFEITEKKVIVVGINELQEFQASVQLYDMLLTSPFVMRTAMPGWEKAGFELVK